MSLDFYLETEPAPRKCCECGSTVMRKEEVFWRNITHNLGKMARQAGIYDALWHPCDKGQVRAKDLIETLEKGLADLRARPAYFKQFDSPSGWGLYVHFVPFVEAVLEACKGHPESLVRASV